MQGHCCGREQRQQEGGDRPWLAIGISAQTCRGCSAACAVASPRVDTACLQQQQHATDNTAEQQGQPGCLSCLCPRKPDDDDAGNSQVLVHSCTVPS